MARQHAASFSNASRQGRQQGVTGRSMSQSIDRGKLEEKVAALVEAARKAGADAADAVAIIGRSTSVSVRLGKVEATESSESTDISLRVFSGSRVAAVSATADTDPTFVATRALAMAKVAPESPHEGLADVELLVREIVDLDLFDHAEVDAERLRQDALATEEAARAVDGVTNSGGAGASAGLGGLVLATSGGFVGHYARTRFGRSVSAIAGEGTGMERDYDFSSRSHFTDLETPEAIGRRAGERAVRRLGPRKVPTGRVNVVYDPRVARGIASHLGSAINGASVARGTSFLKDRMGQQVANSAITVIDDPLVRRGPGSRPFDGEGVAGRRLAMVDGGVLQQWFLSSSVARELGLVTNGRGSRAASSVVPSSTNLSIEPGTASPQDLLKQVGTGFYVTEVFGQGVNMVSGEYSRGAAGFWIEDGELAFPVAEVTIASNLKDMFMNMIPANDVDRNFSTAAPTLLIEGMTLAGS
jgi:PmbA protein